MGYATKIESTLLFNSLNHSSNPLRGIGDGFDFGCTHLEYTTFKVVEFSKVTFLKVPLLFDSFPNYCLETFHLSKSEKSYQNVTEFIRSKLFDLKSVK